MAVPSLVRLSHPIYLPSIRRITTHSPQ